ncbi:MAG: hypothetical protein K940chlam7_00571 [Chlamydiae bacterium]|nr:hypothetical protein [Chlamydiota bacterium]
MANKAKSTSKATQTGAGAGTETRRTTSSAERDQATTRLDQITDVGVDEATMSAVLDQTRAWNANSKACFDTLQEELHSAVKEANAHISELRTIRVNMLANMAQNSDNIQKQHMAHRDIATDRTWTQSNELETMLAAKSGVQADAFVAALMKALGDLNAK